VTEKDTVKVKTLPPAPGEMAEWLNAPVLKTGNCNRFWGSNPCLSAKDVYSPFRDQGAQSRSFIKQIIRAVTAGWYHPTALFKKKL
jgi:hypothetical protein